MPMKSRPAIERFEEKIVRDGVTTCWHWGGGANPHYGSFAKVTTRGAEKRVLAHRYSYQHHVGPIPDGLCLDHICRNKLCVNPAHLRPVTHSENMYAIPVEIRSRPQTLCANGHLLDGDNIIWSKGSKTGKLERACRTCRNLYLKARRRKLAEAEGRTLGEWKKLSDEDVLHLRQMIASAGGKYGAAAKHFGISTAQAWRIANFHRRAA